MSPLGTETKFSINLFNSMSLLETLPSLHQSSKCSLRKGLLGKCQSQFYFYDLTVSSFEDLSNTFQIRLY